MLIQRLTFTPAVLESLPQAERAFVFVLGHALNEINVLTKLMAIAGKFPEEPLVTRHAQVCQAMVIARALAGRLHEAWSAIQKGYYRAKLGQKYDSRLEAEPAACLSSLKAYFGRKNSVEVVRNSFAFHYSLTHAGVEVPHDVPPEELSVYLGPTVGSSLYQYAEYAMGLALLKAIDAASPELAFDRIIMETHEVVGWFNTAAQAMLFEIFDAHTKMSERLGEFEPIEIGDVPHVDSLTLPFFISAAHSAPSPSEA